MFSDNLSDSLLLICRVQRLSYERAAERCGCSSRHFGSIVRQEASPTLGLFERMCQGLGQSPNQLLGIRIEEELSYRSPMAVWETLPCGTQGQFLTQPGCPRCDAGLEQAQAYCARCGQKLDWSAFERAAGRKK